MVEHKVVAMIIWASLILKRVSFTPFQPHNATNLKADTSDGTTNLLSDQNVML